MHGYDSTPTQSISIALISCTITIVTICIVEGAKSSTHKPKSQIIPLLIVSDSYSNHRRSGSSIDLAQVDVYIVPYNHLEIINFLHSLFFNYSSSLIGLLS